MLIEEALRQSRYASGKSQEFIADALGIARKTVQNWERGVSKPTIDQAIQWFYALEISPVPYLYQYVYPNLDRLSASDNDIRLRDALIHVISELPSDEMRQLLYLFYGDHGSSPRAVMNMVTAHLQTPMHDRVTQGSVILKNYEIAKKRDILTDKSHIQPDVELLKRAIEAGESAAVRGVGEYMISVETE